MKKAIIALSALGLMAGACASDPYGYNNSNNQAIRQGTIGAVLGAAAGQAIGGDTRGTVIGAAIGGAIGAARGSAQDRSNQQRYRDNGGSYYYCYDNRQSECYWENGQRRY